MGLYCILFLVGYNIQAQPSVFYEALGTMPTDTVFDELIVKLATPPQRELTPQNGYFASCTNDYFSGTVKSF